MTMAASRLVLAALAVVGAASAAEAQVDLTVAQAAARAEQKAALAPTPLAVEFRHLAAQALRERYPELSRKFLDTKPDTTLDAPATVKSTRSPAAGAPAAAPEAAVISKRIGTMRGLPTDADRTRLTLDLVRDIRALPTAPQRLGLIRSLSNVATEGDLGKDALGAVATTMAAAMRENPAWASGGDYLGLAKLVRYEHLEVASDAALEAALSLLELRERIQQEIGFTLTGMDGKTYSLAGLKGRIVLLNFWATWCPPCRKEMPDMEKLYRGYEKKGLIVLAVSDEERITVEQFLAKNPYSFPVALDPGRKVNAAFSVEGIPKSFIFDREGRLAAQAIDMRTESQFLQLLKLAGLE